MNTAKITLTLFITTLIIQSCTIEKRLYNSGYHVEWKKPRVTQKNTEINTLSNSFSENNATASITETTGQILTVNEPKNSVMDGVTQNIELEVKEQKIINTNIPIESKKEKKNYHFLKSELRNGINEIEKETTARKSNGMAISGFITGIVGMFFLGTILGVLAIIFSSVGLKRINSNPEKLKGKGLAIAGLVLGIIDVIGWTLLIALMFV